MPYRTGYNATAHLAAAERCAVSSSRTCCTRRVMAMVLAHTVLSFWARSLPFELDTLQRGGHHEISPTAPNQSFDIDEPSPSPGAHVLAVSIPGVRTFSIWAMYPAPLGGSQYRPQKSDVHTGARIPVFTARAAL
jgi:hypothetical protein